MLPRILTRLAPGGIVCGLPSDPPPAASERTLGEILPGRHDADGLWWWQSPQPAKAGFVGAEPDVNGAAPGAR